VELRFICSEGVEIDALEYMVREFEYQDDFVESFKIPTACDKSMQTTCCFTP
jgi:hypothetical protein